jgi:hypothetical protein
MLSNSFEETNVETKKRVLYAIVAVLGISLQAVVVSPA